MNRGEALSFAPVVVTVVTRQPMHLIKPRRSSSIESRLGFTRPDDWLVGGHLPVAMEEQRPWTTGGGSYFAPAPYEIPRTDAALLETLDLSAWITGPSPFPVFGERGRVSHKGQGGQTDLT